MPNASGKHAELTSQIIAAFYDVYNTLGSGFAERVYHNALAMELHSRQFAVVSEQPVDVVYRGVIVGCFYADLIVNDIVILELKAAEQIVDEHRAQLLNYLKATKIEVGLLLNFGPHPEIERKVYDNDRKGSLSWLPKP